MNVQRLLRITFMVSLAALPASLPAQVQHPIANPKAEVVVGDARFTVLAPGLIRMEWAKSGQFQDHASLVFINRKQPVPHYTVTRGQGRLVLKTGKLTLRYKPGSGAFQAHNLTVAYHGAGKAFDWHPGMKNTGNLKGTAMTLDGANGAVPLAKGVLSRAGWTLIDDTKRPLFNAADPPWVMPRPTRAHQDWYLFAYGDNYKAALADFTAVSGTMPLPPKWAFGIWRSHYWQYTDKDLIHLAKTYRNHTIPLDVMGVDMDWHWVDKPPGYRGPRWYHGKKRRHDQAKQPIGWTGYTWNPNYFPDPRAYLAWNHRHGLKTFLNLHPANGIAPWERAYPTMAKALGLDPSTRKTIPYDILDKHFVKNYFKLVIDPLDQQGVDFWWLDWQQWEKTKIKGLKVMWWLNHIFYDHVERTRDARSTVYSRWGGLGDQRFGLGFSGDTHTTWKMLDFEPYFTATAANVAFGYWGHDLGGHYGKHPDTPELFTRWVEFGVFSPIFKIHYNKAPQFERRPWYFPPKYYAVLRHYYRLRDQLKPYIYTAARRAYDTGLAIARPLYYQWPDAKQAYQFKNEYLFGDDMMVRPVTQPIARNSLLSEQKVWLPPGRWIEWQTGTELQGNRTVTRSFTVDQTPVYVRAGSIIAMRPAKPNVHADPENTLILSLFPGATSGNTSLYNDAGDTWGYQHGKSTRTRVHYTRQGSGLTLTIDPVRGHYPGMPSARAYRLRLPLTYPPRQVSLDGRKIAYARHGHGAGWHYAGRRAETRIQTPAISVHQKVVVRITFSHTNTRQLSGMRNKIARLDKVFAFARRHHWPDWKFHFDPLVHAAQTGRRVTLKPSSSQAQYSALDGEIDKLTAELKVVAKAHPSYRPALGLLRSLKTSN